MEEKFPTKMVENKSGVFVEYDPASAVAKLSNISSLEPTERFEAFLTQAHLRQAPDHDPEGTRVGRCVAAEETL